MKKILSVLLAVMLLAFSAAPAFAISMEEGIGELNAQFNKGVGPETNGLAIDYRYFSPVDDGDTNKYPLVIFLHGMGGGQKEGSQITSSNAADWVSDEFQARFTNGGAFVILPRSDELKGICWNDGTIEPLKAAIDDFIAQNSENVDLTRIYVGGFSMGGKMTLKMAIAYPEMFAAAFPICPAWAPSEKALSYIADMPIWMTSGKPDPLVNYYFGVSKTYEKLCATASNPENVRFSTLSKVCFEDGKKCSSSHHSWYSVNHDMFSIDNGDYPYMSTVNGLGEEVTLTYPDGMISWLCSHTSDYNGEASVGKGNLEDLKEMESMVGITGIIDFFKTLFNAIKGLFTF